MSTRSLKQSSSDDTFHTLFSVMRAGIHPDRQHLYPNLGSVKTDFAPYVSGGYTSWESYRAAQQAHGGGLSPESYSGPYLSSHSSSYGLRRVNHSNRGSSVDPLPPPPPPPPRNSGHVNAVTNGSPEAGLHDSASHLSMGNRGTHHDGSGLYSSTSSAHSGRTLGFRSDPPSLYTTIEMDNGHPVQPHNPPSGTQVLSSGVSHPTHPSFTEVARPASSLYSRVSIPVTSPVYSPYSTVSNPNGKDIHPISSSHSHPTHPSHQTRIMHLSAASTDGRAMSPANHTRRAQSVPPLRQLQHHSMQSNHGVNNLYLSPSDFLLPSRHDGFSIDHENKTLGV
jgi:hypothetical protein